MKICGYCDNYIAEDLEDKKILLLLNQDSIEDNLETGICRNCKKFEIEEKFHEENE